MPMRTHVRIASALAMAAALVPASAFAQTSGGDRPVRGGVWESAVTWEIDDDSAWGVTLSASACANGAIFPAGTTIVTLGSDRDYVITPAPCYHVADVLVDSVSVGPVVRYTFHDLQTAHTIAARFAITPYTLTASAGPNGGINASGAIHCGASRTFTITPAACYQIEDVLVDGVSVGRVARYTFTNVQADHSIQASFVSGRPAVAAYAGAHGTIVPSGVTTVNCHDNLGFTITPEAGYRVANVWVDGEPMGAVTGYTLADVTANHGIWATFDRSAPAILAGRIREDASLVR